MLKLHSNLCFCVAKLNFMNEAIYCADQAIKIEPWNVGCQYRKGQPYLQYTNLDQNDIREGFVCLKRIFSRSMKRKERQKDKKALFFIINNER
jgi:hypothetical protein